MGFRMLELETKVRTPQSEEVERVFRENLSDLRTLVAKEYCTMIIGRYKTFMRLSIVIFDNVDTLQNHLHHCKKLSITIPNSEILM